MRVKIKGERRNILGWTWQSKGDRKRDKIVKQNAVTTAVIQTSCQVPGPQSEIAHWGGTVRETERGRWRRILRKLKGQNTIHPHQGGGQCQVFASTSQSSTLNGASHKHHFQGQVVSQKQNKTLEVHARLQMSGSHCGQNNGQDVCKNLQKIQLQLS
ncbi:hypothetical protein CHARACLAT_008853 [Characodon lateralis]|uniref:Uncharacterized protein n=1 Tax=Characodon lateralis TaxID=208331 RepID=A0ABU7DYZ2_9TELE|nr:hypothetical protein [Characodon lateralis]